MAAWRGQDPGHDPPDVVMALALDAATGVDAAWEDDVCDDEVLDDVLDDVAAALGETVTAGVAAVVVVVATAFVLALEATTAVEVAAARP